MSTVLKCEVCNSRQPVYTCPKCNIKTCSLNCSSIHKNELNCDGVRDKTAYVSLKKFDNLTLLSDYRLLEDISRNLDNCKRDPNRRFSRHNQQLPTHLYRLKSAARKRNIQLCFMPQHFKRHRENTSKLNFETQVIHWKLDLIFPQSDMIKTTTMVSENTTMVEILSKYLDPVDCPSILKQKLQFYHAAGSTDVVTLLKAERLGANSFYVVDKYSKLKQVLINHVIIEYPIIYVARKDYLHEYNIVDDEAVDPNLETLKGKKRGFFGDFTPINYFTNLNERNEKNTSQSDELKNSIHMSAALLRGKEASEEEDSNAFEWVASNSSFKQINIPSYDDLCAKSVH